MDVPRLILLAAAASVALGACGGQPTDDGRSAQAEGGEHRQGVTSDASPTGEPREVVEKRASGRRKPRGRARRRDPRSVRRTTGPAVRILEPSTDLTAHGGVVTVSVAIEGFKLASQRVRPPFPAPVPGRGHVHFYLDTKTLPTTHSPPSTGSSRSVSGTSYTWIGVAPGRRRFAVQLVGKDHAPLTPPVTDEITVEVVSRSGAPLVRDQSEGAETRPSFGSRHRFGPASRTAPTAAR